jgi:hypothetical protein
MKQIKFKVWDKEENRYFEPIYEAYKGNLLDLSITLSGQLLRRTMNFPAENQSCFPNKYILIEFTGKSTKAGQEIYDGDIMKSDKGILYTVTWSERKNGWCVVTKNVWQPDREYSYKSLNFGVEKCEVIGNINEKQ